MSKKVSRKPTNKSILNESIQYKAALFEAKLQLKSLQSKVVYLEYSIQSKDIELANLKTSHDKLVTAFSQLSRENIDLNDKVYSISSRYQDGLAAVARAAETTKRMNNEYARLSREIVRARELADDGI